MATSSPTPITISFSSDPSTEAAVELEEAGISTYSNPTLTLQLHKTFSVIPGYRSSSKEKSFESGNGAGSDSLALPV